MDDVALANLIAGSDFRPICVGAADHDVAHALNVREGTFIWLSDYTYHKIKYKQPATGFSDYKKIPYILLNGMIVIGKNKKSIDLYSISEYCGKQESWRLSIKVTAKQELFIATFHPSNRGAIRSAERRGNKEGVLIRQPNNEMARRLRRRAKQNT